MYWKHKVQIYLFCVLIAAQPGISKTFLETMRELLTINVGPDIFDGINREILGKISAKNIKFIAPNRLLMDDVEVVDELGGRVLYGRHVSLTISLISLLTNNIRVTDAYVDSPFFHYTVINDIHNVIQIFETPPRVLDKPPSSGSKMRVTIEKVSVENGNYEMYHDAGVEIFAEGISAQGKFWVQNGPFGIDISQVNIAKGAILTAGMDLPITDLVAKNLWISDEKVSTKDLTVFYEKAKLRGQGTVFIEDERYDISATMDAPKGTYPTGLKPLPFIMPAFVAQVTMAGDLTEPEFLADVSMGDTDFNGLAIKRGKIIAQINPHQVVVENAQLDVGKQGKVLGNGSLSIDQEKFIFWSKQQNILAEELSKFLSFKRATSGMINATSKFSGQFSGENRNIRVISQGSIARGQIDDLVFAERMKFDMDIDYILDKSLSIKKARFSDDHGLKLNASGHGNLVDESLALDFDLLCPRVERYVSLPLKSDAIDGLRSNGTIVFNDQGLQVTGPLQVQYLNWAKLSASDVKARLDFSHNRLSLSDITGVMNQGVWQGNVVVDDFANKKMVSGNASAQGIDLSLLSRPFFPINIGGKLAASLSLSGSIDQPKVSFTSEIEDLVVDKAEFKSLQFEGNVTKEHLIIPTLSVITKSGTLDGKGLSLEMASKKIAGTVIVANLNVASVISQYFGRMDGDLDGQIRLDGSLSSPIISADLTASNLSALGIKMGSGAISLALEKRLLLGRGRKEDLVFSVSANLNERTSTNIMRFAIALNEQTINTEFKFDDLEVDTADLAVANDFMGLVAKISGEIFAEGKLNSPVFYAQVVAKEYGVFDPKQRDGLNGIKAMQGPAVLNAFSKEGKLTASLCAMLSEATGGVICESSNALNLSVEGPFSFDAFQLNVLGHVDHSHLENIIPVLKRELVTLDAAANVRGKLIKKKGGSPQFSADLRVDRLVASLPNIPNISLKNPITVEVQGDAIELNGEALLEFLPGKLAIRGSYSRSAVDMHLVGEIPLMLTRIFVPIIQRAEGLAKGDITLSGAVDALIVEGKIVPDPHALFTFRKWLEVMEVREGSILFNKISKNAFVTRFENFKLNLGDGKLFVDGAFEKYYAHGRALSSSKFDLQLKGSNVVFRDRLDFIEADFNIQTYHLSEGGALAKGEVVVTDGSAHRQFDLRNFVAQAQGGFKPGLFKIFSSIDMRMDLDIAIRQFRASARMLNLDIDTILRGQLSSQGPISHPKFKGSISVTEGAIIFPSTSFDLMESQIVLDENSDRVFDPKIEIVATQDLEKNDYPDQIAHDTTVELSLRGDLDRLNLGLRPLRGDMRLSQLKIFLLLLSPRNAGFENASQEDLLRRGAQNAAMAFSGEVFLRPLTNELQELLEGRTKTRIQFGSSIEPGGVSLRFNWKLGPRIELQGSYAFLRDDSNKNQSFTYDSQYSLGDLKLKLLLFDHRPQGPLSLETSFGSTRQVDGKYEPRGKVRLRYSVFSK